MIGLQQRLFWPPSRALHPRAAISNSRVAVANRRLGSLGDNCVSFRWKDYRIEGPERHRDDARSPWPLPDAHVAARLRHIRTTVGSQSKPRQQYRACRRSARSATHRHRRHQGSNPNPKEPKASVPQPHAYHRDLLARVIAQTAHPSPCGKDSIRLRTQKSPLRSREKQIIAATSRANYHNGGQKGG